MAAIRKFDGKNWLVKPDGGIGFANPSHTTWVPKDNIVHRKSQQDSCENVQVLAGRGMEELEKGGDAVAPDYTEAEGAAEAPPPSPEDKKPTTDPKSETPAPTKTENTTKGENSGAWRRVCGV